MASLHISVTFIYIFMYVFIYLFTYLFIHIFIASALEKIGIILGYLYCQDPPPFPNEIGMESVEWNPLIYDVITIIAVSHMTPGSRQF